MTTYSATDLVVQTTTTTGTGTLTLGSAVSGYLALGAAMDGKTLTYSLFDANGTDSETGLGTYTHSGTTFSRDTVYASTNSGSKISLTSGSHKLRIGPVSYLFDGLTGPIQTSLDAKLPINYANTTQTSTASTSSTSYSDLISVSITPKKTTSKIRIIAFLPISSSHSVHLTLTDGSNTELFIGDAGGASQPRVTFTHFNSTTIGLAMCVLGYTHSPASTSSQTYKIRWRANTASTQTCYFGRGGSAEANNDAWGRMPGMIEAMEIYQ